MRSFSVRNFCLSKRTFIAEFNELFSLDISHELLNAPIEPMSSDFHLEQSIFDAALLLSLSDRCAYLDEACKGDAELRKRVEELLEAHDQGSAFLENPPSHVTLTRTAMQTASITETVGERIGRYKLLQQIGEGGCGVVYMAEQLEPVRRQVALKIIKLGMDTKQVIARFEAERQALALMDHPNIAKVLDAGSTETGRPYFVMELVRGTKITEFCDKHLLTNQERLKLFIQVCQAVQHAHQKGIIHRDLKPSNILVTLNDGVPLPKVIDFGIAKATQDRLTDKTLFTAFEQFIGTPAYMSPEQAEMNAQGVDTRSDIYSLGVLLYELLTGRTPFESQKLLQAGVDEIRRIIREQEPQRPSTKLSTLQAGELTATATSRQTKPPQLIHTIRGDLDWIAMKALEKDRNRRYETVNGLAADIRRHLNNEPVVARPPSGWYEFRKTFRRHRTAFAMAGLFVAMLIAGIYLTTTEAVRARRAEAEQIRLRKEADLARANETALRRRLEYRLEISQANSLFSTGKKKEAEKVLNAIRPESFEPTSEQAAVLKLLSWEYAKEDNWTNALANLAALVPIERPEWPGYHFAYSTALAMANDKAGAGAHQRDLAARLSYTNDPEGSEFLCRLALLMPAEKDVMQSLAPFACAAQTRTNYQSERMRDRKAWNRFALALYSYRNGDNTNTLKWIADCFALGSLSDPTVAPCARAVKAMALYRLGQVDQAKLEISEARKILDPVFQQGVSQATQNEGRWYEWYQAEIYFNEAEQLMETPPR